MGLRILHLPTVARHVSTPPLVVFIPRLATIRQLKKHMTFSTAIHAWRLFQISLMSSESFLSPTPYKISHPCVELLCDFAAFTLCLYMCGLSICFMGHPTQYYSRARILIGMHATKCYSCVQPCAIQLHVVTMRLLTHLSLLLCRIRMINLHQDFAAQKPCLGIGEIRVCRGAGFGNHEMVFAIR